MALKVVSTQSSSDLERRAASGDFKGAARVLAANILRIARGAGASYRILRDIGDLATALDRYYVAHGAYPSEADWQRALSASDAWGELRPHTLSRYDDYGNLDEGQRLSLEVEEARDRICNGALQVIASRLLKQVPQEAAGTRELSEGIRQHRDALNKHNEHFFRTTSGRSGKAALDALLKTKSRKRTKAKRAARSKPKDA